MTVLKLSMTAVAPPQNVHKTWNGGLQGGLESMTSDIFVPRGKGNQRYNMSTSSSASFSALEGSSMAGGAWASSLGGKKKGTTRGPVSAGSLGSNANLLSGWPKTDMNQNRVGGVVGAGNVSSQSHNTTNGLQLSGHILPSQHILAGKLQQAGNGGQPQPSYLMLLPLNGTFERKQILLPYLPETLRIGRQTNAKTVPTPTNGYFDSKVLSRQHAEIWTDKITNKVWIRDIKSSNGTFVNGQRLSPEGQESGPHELRTEDVLELGIDIVGEDNKTIIHHKVAARVEHAGVHIGGSDLNFGDLEPLVNGSLFESPSNSAPPPNNMRGRSGSQSSRASTTNGVTGPAGNRQAPNLLASVSMEMVVKRLNRELFVAKQQSQDLNRTAEVFDIILKSPPPKVDPGNRNDNPVACGGSHTNGVLETSSACSPIIAHLTTGVSRQGTPDVHRSSKLEKATKPDPPQQVLSLVGELAKARKEVELNSTRIQDLEDALKKEKQAREVAEDRATQLENTSRLIRKMPSFCDLSNDKPKFEESGSQTEEFGEELAEKPPVEECTVVGGNAIIAVAAAESASTLQRNMEEILNELKTVKLQMESFKIRADAAEARAECAERERDSNRKTLAETIRLIRKEDEKARRIRGRGSQTETIHTTSTGVQVEIVDARVDSSNSVIRNTSTSNIPPAAGHKEAALLFRKENAAPYAGVLGVVLFGVGLMAVINAWPRGDR